MTADEPPRQVWRDGRWVADGPIVEPIRDQQGRTFADVARQYGAIMPPSHRAAVLAEVLEECWRQDQRWGEQNHVDGTGPTATLLGMTFGVLADRIRAAVDSAARQRSSTWALILLEEVFEALAEDDDPRLRHELVQVAAVATQWVEVIDRRRAAEAST